MTADDLRAWHDAMGHTYDTGAKALGVSRGTYADWLAGRSRTTGKPIQISRLVALACAALAAGLGEWTPPELPDQAKKPAAPKKAAGACARRLGVSHEAVG